MLFSSEISDHTAEEQNKLKRIENSVYRVILQLPPYTATCALREIGTSSCLAIDMKIKLLFAKHLKKET